ncbi:histone-lysine N-methyltransferase PRDM9-like [Chrysoperla carnea]|uniref:histone-lysine N-methyltransferase PRDM9-like n=1 Tax=Chrysoperla carnea TaxID=189513 RepID=UPI001D08910F|nr:histone-lysine N-methyltransferase PRDM9-like [Chrysoperla carnea]
MSNDLLHDEKNWINEEDIKLEFFTEEDIKLELQIKEEILDENCVDGYQQIQSVDNKLPDDIASMRKSVYIIEESIKQEHEIDSKLIIKDEILVENSSDDDQQAQIVRKQSTDGETFMKESVLGRSTNEYCKRATRKKNYSENKCGVCGMIFKLKSDLVEHIEHSRVQTMEKSYLCDRCNETFTLKCDLYKHKKQTHFECRICGMVLKGKYALPKHERQHIEKSYSCDVCNELFISNITLLEHKKVQQDY